MGKVILMHEIGFTHMLDFEADSDNLDFYYKHIECDCIDITRPYKLQKETGKCENIIFILDDEGALKENPKVNLFGSIAYGYPLCGNILVAKEEYTEEDVITVGLTEEDIKEFSIAMMEMVDKLKG